MLFRLAIKLYPKMDSYHAFDIFVKERLLPQYDEQPINEDRDKIIYLLELDIILRNHS